MHLAVACAPSWRWRRVRSADAATAARGPASASAASVQRTKAVSPHRVRRGRLQLPLPLASCQASGAGCYTRMGAAATRSNGHAARSSGHTARTRRHRRCRAETGCAAGPRACAPHLWRLQDRGDARQLCGARQCGWCAVRDRRRRRCRLRPVRTKAHGSHLQDAARARRLLPDSGRQLARLEELAEVRSDARGRDRSDRGPGLRRDADRRRRGLAAQPRAVHHVRQRRRRRAGGRPCRGGVRHASRGRRGGVLGQHVAQGRPARRRGVRGGGHLQHGHRAAARHARGQGLRGRVARAG